MQRFILALLWGLFLTIGVEAQQLPPATQFAGCVTTLDPTFATGSFGRLRCDSAGNLLTTGGGGGGGGSSPPGQYNSTLPTFASGQTGYLSVDQNGRLIVSPGTPINVVVGAYGLGAMTAVPAASTNGTPLSTSPPAAKRGARLYVVPGGSLTFTIAAAQPGSAPTAVVTVANPSTATSVINWDEDLNAQMIYITASTGANVFRWY